MSADKDLENDVSSFFISKPIRPDDVRNLWQFAAKKGSNNDLPKDTSRTNCDAKSSSSQQRRDKAKGLKWRGESSEEKRDNSQSSSTKKAKLVWTNTLHNRFLEAIRSIGHDRTVPKKILEVMNVPGLTREHVASHLQKYRNFLRRVSDASYKMQCSEEKCLSRNCKNRPSPSFLNLAGRSSFRQFQYQEPGRYIPGSFASTTAPLYNDSSSELGQSQFMSRLKPGVLESNIRHEDQICQQNDRIAQTTCTTASLFPGHLSYNMSLGDFCSSLPGLNGISPSVSHQGVSYRSSNISPMPSVGNFAGQLNQTNYLDWKIARIENLTEWRSCRRSNSCTTTMLSNDVLNNNGNAAVSLPNDNIILDQLMSQYHVGTSCSSITASDRSDSKQLSDVIAGYNQNLLLASNTASPEILEFEDQIRQSASNPVYDLPAAFDSLVDTQQPLNQEGCLDNILQDQVNMQTQAQISKHNGVEIMTSSSFYGCANHLDNNVSSLDQTAFTQQQSPDLFSTSSQFNNSPLSDPFECYNEDDEFLESLFAPAGPFEEP